MSIDLNNRNFVLTTFIESEIDKKSLKINEDLTASLINLHATHVALHRIATESTLELYKLFVSSVKQAIDEGSATKETKEIFDKIYAITDNLDKGLDNNLNQYNYASNNFIKALNDLGIN